ncbi:MAG: hypothetical protein ACFUZC_04820 [Chthoniobacteraceae bacterium]
MKILKRPGTGSDNYYVRFEHRGKQYLRSTGSPVLAAAKVNAKRIRDSIVIGDGKDAERLKLKSDYATIQDILDRYKARAGVVLELMPKTVRGNMLALKAICRKVMGEEVNLAHVKASELTAKLLETYKLKCREASAGDYCQAERSKRSANSTITQARSLFTKGAMPLYEGLKLPDLKEFKEVAKFSLQQGTPYLPIPAPVIEAMEKEAHGALREKAPAQYLGYLMAIRLGMRDCEMVEARWEWLEEWPTGTQMAIIVRPYFAPKGSEGRVPVSDDVLSEIKALGGPLEGGKGYILPAANQTERSESIYRGLSAWVRGYLPDRVKSVHELRKHAGSIVATQTKSLVHAQRFLRHRSVVTTERHYATLLDQLAPLTSAMWQAWDPKKEQPKKEVA